MSEYQPLPYQPIEDDAVAILRLSDDIEFAANRRNTVLNTYLGRAAFDNIVVNDEIGMLRMFREVEQFEQVEQFIYENDFQMVLNQVDVPELVQRQYVDMVMSGMDDDIQSLE